MANKRICIQLDYDGPSPLTGTGPNDKRTTLINLARLIRSFNHGSQFRQANPSKLVYQQTLVQASATCTPSSVQAADHLDIGGTALTATQLRAKGTLTFASAIAGDTVVINGVTFTAVNGAVVLGEATFDIRTSDTAAAASLAAQVAAYADPRLSGVVGIKSAAAVATVYAKAIGTAGNGITLNTTGGTITKSGATLSGGAAAANNQFDYIGTNAETGADLKRAINASTTAAVKQTSATVTAAGVVTVTAKTPGVAGNAITFTSNNARLTVTGSGFLASGSAGAPTEWTF